MGLSHKGSITPWKDSWAFKQEQARKLREAGSLLPPIDDHVLEDEIAIASIRENIRLFNGIDRVWIS